MAVKGINRYFVKCAKCGYEWLSYSKKPTRCALCNNPNIDQPKVKLHQFEKGGE